ncbi:division/cell wall cluster transcriptional repressor MraZ [Candidatus Cyrtobacter comes]|nr:cell division/cell wall cluster transcriptional repressor MraZ [Candidatus Cyrtobacter comes]
MQNLGIFISTYESKLDSAKRASIPPNFRDVIAKLSVDGLLYAYPSILNECIEVCTPSRINNISVHIEGMEMFSRERDEIATAVLSTCYPVQLDKKGRIAIPEFLLDFAQISNNVSFVGKGEIFEIWNVDKFAQEYKRVRGLLKVIS